MAKMTPRTLSGFMELLPQPQQQMERMMQILREADLPLPKGRCRPGPAL